MRISWAWTFAVLSFLSFPSAARTLETSAAPDRPADVPITCGNLDGASVFSQEPAPQYLGFFGTATAANSINNRNGQYGSSGSSTSVRNTFGPYGSSTSIYSANNATASAPPIIVRYGLTIGYLTTNGNYTNPSYPFENERVMLGMIDGGCTFSSTAPAQAFTDQVGEGGFDVSFTGFWWNPARSGEGLLLEFSELNGEPILFLAFFTYDLTGNPLYLAGSVSYPRNFGGTLTVPVVSTRGGRFGANFDPSLVQRPAWGNLTITVNGCDSLTLGYASSVPGYGTGTIAMTRFLQRDPFHLCP